MRKDKKMRNSNIGLDCNYLEECNYYNTELYTDNAV